jgi:YfiH family protein
VIAARAETLGPVRVLLTDRRGGSSRSPWDSLNLADHVGDDASAVRANRRRVARAADVAEMVVIDAEHGRSVHRVGAAGRAPKGDALLTTRPELGLLALSADCVAGAVVAPDQPAVAVFHCGWRGLAAGIVPATVAALRELGADPSHLLARLGPAICPDCYEVSAEVRSQVAAAVPQAWATTARGAPAIDLVAGTVGQLQATGCGAIDVDDRCTAETETLFSHRRDGVTGRQGVLAVLGAAP